MKCPPGTVKATRTIPSKKTGGSPKVETYCKVIGGTKDKKGPKSPYKMYGKTSSPLKGGSPLAKYGCSKRHSPLKQEPEKTSKDLKSTKILKAVGGEEAMAKAYTKQTGSTLYSGPLYEAFKNKYAQDRFGNV